MQKFNTFILYKKNFDLEGNFVDNYFNIKSKTKIFLATNIT